MMSDCRERVFRIALTGDFYDAGKLRFADVGLDLLATHAGIEYRAFAEHQPEISSQQIGDAQGVIVLTPRVTANSLSHSKDLLAIGRFGVGFDGVDVPACTAADVVLFITPGAVDRPVAEAALAWMLALTHHVRAKDRLVREGRWDDRAQYMGCELRERTLGVVGMGGIGRALVGLLKCFGMNRPLAFDPFLDRAAADHLGVEIVSLDELLARADFVSLHCPLNEQTRGLIGARELARMKKQAYLINTARGGIVDEDALYDALRERRIAGAAIDCFVDEPLRAPHRFGEFENVIMAPHCIAFTAEMFRDIGRTVCQGMIDLAVGKRPRGVVNPQVFDRASFVEKWERLAIAPIG